MLFHLKGLASQYWTVWDLVWITTILSNFLNLLGEEEES
jgi:hypothetical protein